MREDKVASLDLCYDRDCVPSVVDLDSEQERGHVRCRLYGRQARLGHTCSDILWVQVKSARPDG